MEQNREPRNKPTYIQSTHFQQKCQGYVMGKGRSLQQTVLGKLGSHMLKDETGSLP